MLIYGDGVRAGVDLGTRGSFADIGATVLDCLGVSGTPIAGESFWNDVKGEV
jgi:phosphopentomutase